MSDKYSAQTSGFFIPNYSSVHGTGVVSFSLRFQTPDAGKMAIEELWCTNFVVFSYIFVGMSRCDKVSR